MPVNSKDRVKIVLALITSVRLVPHMFIYFLHKNHHLIREDVKIWIKANYIKSSVFVGFLYLLTYLPNFRNLYYKRIGWPSFFISWLAPKMNTLFIVTEQIGGGLYIEHGFSTIITAKSIGKDCWINQQVTIGFNNNKCPSIGDNVRIGAGAKILGGIIVGSNVVIGANAVVVKDVPPNCTVVGVPARIIRRNGVKVDEAL